MSLSGVVLLLIPYYTVNGDSGGNFGTWNEDNTAYDLPYYTYELDQINNPIATTYANATIYQPEQIPIANATDHLFQFGNDRIVLIASNYGYVKMRSDETAPKFLNDFNRKHSQFGGGLGYIYDNKNNLILSTFYNGKNNIAQIKRDYGIYYRRYYSKDLTSNISLKQTLIAPFGDDPVVISQIVIENNMMNNITYSEVWSGAMLQLAMGTTDEQRRQYQNSNYNVSYSNISSTGIQSNFKFKGKVHSNGQWLWDETPPMTFLMIIGEINENVNINIGCEMNTFFGSYGAESPSFTVSCSSLNQNNIKNTGMILEISNITTSSIKFNLIYGYSYNQDDIYKLISKYNNQSLLDQLYTNTASLWYNDAIKFNSSKYPEIQRELLWHYGYMRSALTFYNLFNEYVLDQGTYYRYTLGFEGAFRDPLQHILPLIYTSPNIVKSVIRFCLKQIQSPFNNTNREYDVPYGLEGNGIILNLTISKIPSDLELYLLLTVSEYILITKDIDFLYESVNINIFNNIGNKTVLECLLEAYDFLHSHINVGIHGVIRLQSGDWNDGIATMENNNYIETLKKAESGLNTAMLTYVLPKFITVLNMIGINKQSMHEFIDQQENVLNTVLWNGKWLNRAWVPISADPINNDGVWMGSPNTDNSLFLWPQIYGLLSNALNITRKQILFDNINNLLRNYSNYIGALQLSIPFKEKAYNGTVENGGIWHAINHPLIIALSTINATLAKQEWIANSLANRANIYPMFWPNIWSSADYSNSILVSNIKASAVGTSGWPNFPILCTHAHSWPLYSFVNGLIGVMFDDKDSMAIKPSFKIGEEFSFETNLLGVYHEQNLNYYGYYKPVKFIGKLFKVVLDLNNAMDINDNDKNKWLFEAKIDVQYIQAVGEIQWFFDYKMKLLTVSIV
eukprot:174977_1